MGQIHDFDPEILLAPWCDCRKGGECQGKCLGSNIERTIKEAYGTQGLAFLKAHLIDNNMVGGNKHVRERLHREESNEGSPTHRK